MRLAPDRSRTTAARHSPLARLSEYCGPSHGMSALRKASVDLCSVRKGSLHQCRRRAALWADRQHGQVNIDTHHHATCGAAAVTMVGIIAQGQPTRQSRCCRATFAATAAEAQSCTAAASSLRQSRWGPELRPASIDAQCAGSSASRTAIAAAPHAPGASPSRASRLEDDRCAATRFA